MPAFLARRLLATIPVLLIVAVIIFLMTRLAPGDPATAIVGNDASAATLDAVRTQLGLKDPLPLQFGRWLLGVLHGDLGQSFFMKQPVAKLIGQRIEPTVALSTLTIVITILLAVPLGVLAAWRLA